MLSKKMKQKLFWTLAVGIAGMWVGVGRVEAANYTLTPSSSSTSVGSNLVVDVGIESGTDKVYAADIWMTFDAAKLELVSIDKIENNNFSFTLGDKNIDNTAGTVKVALIPAVSSSLDSKVVAGGVAKLTFRAKATGVASALFTCTAGNLNDSNIIDPNSADVITCGSNQSGSYTITAGTGGESTPVPTLAATTTSSELPRTGVDGPTVALVIMGIMSLFGAVYFVRI